MGVSSSLTPAIPKTKDKKEVLQLIMYRSQLIQLYSTCVLSLATARQVTSGHAPTHNYITIKHCKGVGNSPQLRGHDSTTGDICVEENYIIVKPQQTEWEALAYLPLVLSTYMHSRFFLKAMADLLYFNCSNHF